MIRHTRHGSSPRLLALQSILSPSRRESLPAPSAGVRIIRCENASKFQTLQDIDRPGVKAVVNPGGTNERFARGNLKDAEIVVFPDNTWIFEEIAAGKADLM